jgi:hypothetical protein
VEKVAIIGLDIAKQVCPRAPRLTGTPARSKAWRCAIDVFVDEREGQCRGRGDTTGQRLRGHWRENDRRVDAGAVAMAAGILNRTFCRTLAFTRCEAAPRRPHPCDASDDGSKDTPSDCRQVIFDALARQMFRQGLAATLLALRLFSRCKAGARQVDKITDFVASVLFIGNLLGFIKEPINVLFALWRKTMQPCEYQLFLELNHAFRELTVFRLQRCNARHQLLNSGFAEPVHQILESEPFRRFAASTEDV